MAKQYEEAKLAAAEKQRKLEEEERELRRLQKEADLKVQVF